MSKELLKKARLLDETLDSLRINQSILSKTEQHQNNSNLHPLTCGYNSSHPPLVGKEIDGKVILVCTQCHYTQKNIPEYIIEHPIARPDSP